MDRIVTETVAAGAEMRAGGTHHRPWDEFTQWQWVTARNEAHAFPF